MTIPAVIIPLLGMPGWQEMLIIGLLVAVLFGAKKLPQLGKGLGEGIRNFKSGLKGAKEAEVEITEASK